MSLNQIKVIHIGACLGTKFLASSKSHSSSWPTSSIFLCVPHVKNVCAWETQNTNRVGRTATVDTPHNRSWFLPNVIQPAPMFHPTRISVSSCGYTWHLSVRLSLCKRAFDFAHVNFTIFGITVFELPLFGIKQLILITFSVYYLQKKIYWHKSIWFWAIMHCFGNFWPFLVEFYCFGHKMVKNCLNNASLFQNHQDSSNLTSFWQFFCR